MIITQSASAGTMESSDIQIRLEPGEGNQLEIHLQSAVEKQYGDHIRALIRNTLEGLGVTKGTIHAVDKGALDCTIRARVKTAVSRACTEIEMAGRRYS